MCMKPEWRDFMKRSRSSTELQSGIRPTDVFSHQGQGTGEGDSRKKKSRRVLQTSNIDLIFSNSAQ